MQDRQGRASCIVIKSISSKAWDHTAPLYANAYGHDHNANEMFDVPHKNCKEDGCSLRACHVLVVASVLPVFEGVVCMQTVRHGVRSLSNVAGTAATLGLGRKHKPCQIHLQVSRLGTCP